MRSKYIIGGLIIVGFTIWAAISFNSSLTPYVTIGEARQSNETVQVKGERVGSGHFDVKTNQFRFQIRDENGELLDVVYDGAKPGNFDQASHIVCVGKYENGVFHAKELLVKCPSKYQPEGSEL
ncbi:cytochrome c maturation protein CcmE domain-containing protein [Caldithrix abyssi]|uniref:Cytochrome c-type biogenesis protein CcmE n=1 Tax=Caldithrix abyssi DSM 13497 TaxID=880073 RepID=H1XY33_CALAY|nr:cytochrome c maturation protein CcmE [Caldithrix abyssi]APF17902.1 cytochrome c-type biogenesis protein CcmE [Caldithrix abyssi DSM 13497]EHO41960.1 cytochrome c-type biogenesis protein CcmE, putative [Caldithrix abyssi DSM 13497]